MNEFEICVRQDPKAGPDGPHGIAIRAGNTVFTQLLRPGVNDADDYLRAPPTELAFWFIDNWWRVRWESIIPGQISPEWRLAHELASIGGGYAWPRLSIWGEGVRTGISCRSDPPGVVGPVRYVTDALMFISASVFEQAVDDFLRIAVDGAVADHAALKAHHEALMRERGDAEIAAWRRLEAQLGFDPDGAPEDLMRSMAALVARYGADGVAEAAIAAQGEGAAELLEREIAAARRARLSCKLGDVVKAAGRISKGPDITPWTVAETAANRVRNSLGICAGPLRNKGLGELLNIGKDAFRTRVRASTPAYGLRLKNDEDQSDSVAMRAIRSHHRRFELCRVLGDAIWSGNDALGPLTNANSARQKFQRAFAQSLLCPFDDLIAYINTDIPTDDDISAVARHFHVSERVVQTILVNQHVIGHERFDEMVEAA